MAGGLERGTDDFKAVLAAFKNKTYSVYKYSAEAILKSNPAWESKYDPIAFAESVRNLVANLRLTLPEFPDPEHNQHLPNPELPTTRQLPEGFMNPSPGTIPPFAATANPSGAQMVSNERLLVVPKQVVAWVDTTNNQNSRVTVYVLMPPGFAKEHYKVRVTDGGTKVEIDYEWPEEMLDPVLLMKGHDHYDAGHNKIVAFQEHVKELQNFKKSNKVKSVCQIFLPFQVEEQFCSLGVPRPTYTTTTSGGHKILAIELMGVRSNYQTQKVEQEYDDSHPPPHNPHRHSSSTTRQNQQHSSSSTRQNHSSSNTSFSSSGARNA